MAGVHCSADWQSSALQCIETQRVILPYHANTFQRHLNDISTTSQQRSIEIGLGNFRHEHVDCTL